MRIKIEPLLPTGNYLNKRYSIEMDFPDGSNPQDNFKYLNDIITAIHMSEYPLLYKEGKPLFSNYQGEEGEDKPVKEETNPLDITIQGIIQDINACTVVDEKNGLGVQVGLVAYEQLATKYPLVQEAYLIKLKQLQP